MGGVSSMSFSLHRLLIKCGLFFYNFRLVKKLGPLVDYQIVK